MTVTVSLPARPESIDLGVEETAVIVNDMQNGFVSAGGFLDKAGFDISGAAAVTEQVAIALDVARAANLPILYFQNGFDARLNSAPEGSPIWHKSPALRLMRQRPELAGTLLTMGTWDYAIIEPLTPRSEDIVIDKPRANCFAGTNLDMLLRARGIRNIVVIGISSNVGVEWTMRDGLTREYFCVMLEDATMAAGPAFVHEATIYNVENFIGWVSTTNDFKNAFEN
jgi:ureidoacrylate peracid hydrolase